MGGESGFLALPWPTQSEIPGYGPVYICLGIPRGSKESMALQTLVIILTCFMPVWLC